MINNAIRVFLIVLMIGFVIYGFQSGQEGAYICAAVFLPLFLVFNNRVNRDKKLDRIADTIEKK